VCHIGASFATDRSFAYLPAMAARALERLPLRDALRAWALSRALCWVAGVAAVLAFGAHAGRHDLLGLTSPFGSVGDTLVAPAARWDAFWYVLIADHGYVAPRATQFYPLYPLVSRVVGSPVASSLVGGIAVSLASLLGALHLLQRLASIELRDELGRRTMLLLAFFPTAVFFSAVYTEGLFLLLSIGSVYAGRRGRWAWAGATAGLATLARPTGVLLAVPLALLYLYGPRGDRGSPEPRPELAGAARIRPRYRPARDALWLMAIPAGFATYSVYVWAKFGDPFVVLKQGEAWNLHFTLPFVTVWNAAGKALSGAADVFHGRPPNDVYEFGFMVLACVATVGALRRLPLAYGAYAAAGVVFLLCFPTGGASLASFSRYMAPLFPIFMWLAAWSTERRAFRWVLLLFAVGMVVQSARFATWHFVA
jgi:hypothetical protein